MLPAYNSGLVAIINKILQRSGTHQATEGIIYAIDGVRIDIRIPGSAVVLRNVPVIGDIEQLQVGQTISLRWEYDKPVALATTNTGLIPISVTIQADGDTLENSPIGLRVKAGGIHPCHLAFVPSIEGHTHLDLFQRMGWTTTTDGAIYKDDTYIHPDGQICLGSGTNVIKLDSKHITYRLWAGSSLPEEATFSVTKDGKVYATAGEIAGWEILSDRLSKNNAELRSAGELLLGTGNDVAVLSSVNLDGWRLWIGNADPSLAPFRVTKTGVAYIYAGVIKAALESENYVEGLSGWKLFSDGRLEAQDVVVRGRIVATVFAEETISAVSGEMIISLGATLIADVDTEDTTIDLDSDVISLEHILHFQPGGGRSEWMRVITAAQPITGGFRYGVERNIAGFPASENFYKGEPCVCKGKGFVARDAYPLAAGEAGSALGSYQPAGAGETSGGGWLSLDGAAPYFAVNARYGASWDQFQRVVQIGNLVGCPLEEYVTETWGSFFGDENGYLVYDMVNGLRVFFLGAVQTAISKDGLFTDRFYLDKQTSAPNYSDQRAVMWFDYQGGLRQLKVRIKDDTYEVEQALGDMLKSVYDTDADGVVDDAEKLGGSLPSSYFLVADHTKATHDALNIDANAIKLQSRTLDSAAPADLDHVQWDNGNSKWAPRAAFNDAGQDPAPLGTTADGTATYPSRADHVHGHIVNAAMVVVIPDESCATGDGKFYLPIPSQLNGYNLVWCNAKHITAGSGGNPTLVQIRNVTDSQDMLSTRIMIDVGELCSSTATTAYVINTSYDDVATYDLLAVDVDQLPTTAPKGLIITLGFQKPPA